MKHKKLVRDKISSIITVRGEKCITRILDAVAFRQALWDKLQEEVAEFGKYGDLGELIDILEVVYAIAAEAGMSQCELEEMRQQKRRERGGFEDRIFLIETLAGDVP